MCLCVFVCGGEGGGGVSEGGRMRIENRAPSPLPPV